MRKYFVLLVAMSLMLGCVPEEKNETAADVNVGQEQNLYQQGMDALDQGDLPNGVRLLEEAAQRSPQKIQALSTLSQIYLRLRAFDNAIASTQKIIELQPNNGFAYFLLAGCYDMKGEPDKAIENVKKSMELFQQANDMENYTKAEETLKKLLAPTPVPEAAPGSEAAAKKAP